jgi:F0F1-type ATP synthase membrane subunit b/b'
VDAAKLNLNPITQIEPLLVVAIVLVFIALYFALRHVFVRPYLAVLEARERRFAHAENSLARGNETQRAADFEAERVLTEASTRAEIVRTESEERCDEYRRSRIAEASSKAGALLDEGRARIAAERAKQSAGMRGEVETCVGIACTRLLGASDSEAVSSAVERAVSRRIG